MYEDKYKVVNFINKANVIKQKEYFTPFKNHEIKFYKCNGKHTFDYYSEMLKAIFECEINFRCVVFSKTDINHKKHNGSSQNPQKTGFYKLYYQHLYHQFIKDNDYLFKILIDERHGRQNTLDIQTLTNCISASKFNCLRRVGRNRKK